MHSLSHKTYGKHVTDYTQEMAEKNTLSGGSKLPSHTIFSDYKNHMFCGNCLPER